MHEAPPDRPEGGLAQGALHICRFKAHNQAAGPLLACAVVLLLGASTGHSQWLETRITLPDSLGGAVYPICLTTDTSERYVYVGDGSRHVFVVDAETRTRVAKLPCGVVAAVCTSTRRNKVYAADFEGNQVFAISCATNQVVATIPTGACPLALCYNSVDDKVYSADTAGHDLTVIDCSPDVVLKTIQLEESPIEMCYNRASNRVFGRTAMDWEEGKNELLVIDGAGDSVVAVHPDTWSGPMLAAAVVNKVYVSSLSGLKALDGSTGAVLDSPNVSAEPMCFNSRTRKLYAYDSNWRRVSVLDCTADTLFKRRIWLNDDYMYAMACETTSGRVYASCENPGEDVLEVIDGNGDSSIARIAGPHQGKLLASSKRGCMYSTDQRVPEVTVYDLSTDSLLRTIMIGANVGAMCYDSADDKIYYTISTVLGEVGVIDASTNQPVGHLQVGPFPRDIIWHAPTNRVYCGGAGHVTVIDPKADTISRVLPVNWCLMLCSAPSVNKVYAVSYDSSGHVEVAVIDCKGDSVVKTIALPTYFVWSMCHVLTSSYDKLYISADGAIIIIDCISDSLVRSYPSGYSYVAAGRDGRRVHLATMDSLCTFDPAGDTLVASVPWDAYGLGGPLLYVPDADKVYCACPKGGQNSIMVADAATDSLIAQIPLLDPDCLGYDAPNKLVHIRCSPGNVLAFVDSRSDSVVVWLNLQVDVATTTMASPQHRLYVGPASGHILGSSMPVIRTDPPGVEEAISAERGVMKQGASVVRGVLVLSEVGSRQNAEYGAKLMDVSGRKVMDLRPGANDVRALAPGVYFVREALAQAQAQAVRKVVVTR